jgi:hypothetical protein
MQRLLLLVVLAAALSACGAARPRVSSPQSEYPYDYATLGECQQSGPVRLCRAYQMFYGLAVLDIDYAGQAVDRESMSAFVRVNYQDGPRQGAFPLRLPGASGQVRVTGGCLVGKLGGCEQQGTAAMRDLLQWAQRPDRGLNALDVEIAVVDGAGHWDSQDGANYRFHFAERLGH